MTPILTNNISFQNCIPRGEGKEKTEGKGGCERFCILLIVTGPVKLQNCGPVQTKDLHTPLSIRSGHLDIKDEQCAESKDGHKISYHIKLRLDAVGVQKCNFLKK